MSNRRAVFLLLVSLFILSLAPISHSEPQNHENDEDDILSFLEKEDAELSTLSSHSHSSDESNEEGGGGCSGNSSGGSDDDDYAGAAPAEPEVDERDVVVLKESNFKDAIENNRHVMVEFYAPWCGHCKALAPEYAAAATELRAAGEDVVLAKVDAIEETELAKEYKIEGFPEILFFVGGEHKQYSGGRNKDAIVTWIKKKIGPGIYNLSTTEEAEKILSSASKVVLAYLQSLVGSESDELSAASKTQDDVNFYQTMVPSIAKLFHIDAEARPPALVFLKQQVEKINHFDGEFSKSAISEFVLANKLPLVSNFTLDSASIFESKIQKKVFLFASSKNSENLIPAFQEAARIFKGKLLFAYVPLDNEEIGKPIAEYFGIKGDAPQALGFAEGKKYFFDGEMTSDRIKVFGEDFLADKLEPSYKSDPIPEINNGDVKIVVGKNFEQVVMDESKDVLLEIYAPWCGHCQALELTYNKLAKHFKGIDSLVIAKMDGTTNDHPSVQVDGFPTILFFPAGDKRSEPISYEMERTLVDFYKFIKKHASITFKFQKPVLTMKSDGSDASKTSETSSLKDEL